MSELPKTEREWQYLVTRHGIAGTAQFLQQQQGEILQLRQRISELEATIAKASQMGAYQSVVEENKQLRELLAQGGQHFVGIDWATTLEEPSHSTE